MENLTCPGQEALRREGPSGCTEMLITLMITYSFIRIPSEHAVWLNWSGDLFAGQHAAHSLAWGLPGNAGPKRPGRGTDETTQT